MSDLLTKVSKMKRLWFFLAILIISLSLTKLILPVATIIILALYLPLPSRLSKSGWFRILLAISLYAGISAFVALVFYTIHFSLPEYFASLIYLVVFFAGSLIVSRCFQRVKPEFKNNFHLAIPAIIVTLFFGANIFIGPNFSHSVSQASILQSISKAEDDAGNHLMIFSRFFMNNNSSVDGQYTFGSEWFTSLLANSIIPSQTAPAAILMVDAYVIFKLLLLVFSIFALTILVDELYKKLISDKKNNLTKKIFAVVASIALGVFIVAPLYRNGFYSFIPTIGYLALFYIFLLSAIDSESRLLAVIYGLLLTIAISTSWFIPVAVCFTVLFFVSLPLLKNHWRKIIPFFAISALCLLLVLYTLFSHPEATSASDMLTLWGGYPIIHRIFAYAIVVIAICFILYEIIKKKQRISTPHILYLIFGILLVAAIYAFFMIKQGMPSYYYFKIETTLLAIALPVAFIFVARILHSWRKQAVWLSFVIFIGIFMTYPLESEKSDYLQYITDVNNTAATVEIDIAAPIIDKLNRPIFDEYQKTCYIMINQIYQETVNANALANNATNTIVKNKCMIDGKLYIEMFNGDGIDFQEFVKKANEYGVNYEIWGKKRDGDIDRLINVTDGPNVSIHEY